MEIVDDEVHSESQLNTERCDDIEVFKKDMIDDIEVIDICSRSSKEFEFMAANNVVNKSTSIENIMTIESLHDIPDCVLWPTILSAFDSCTDFNQLVEKVNKLKDKLPPMKEHKTAVYCPSTDTIDRIAQEDIPADGPIHLKAIVTQGDGNCLCRAASKGQYNTDIHHIELRVCILIEGVTNIDFYLSDECLERGATFIHKNANLPTVFTTFSEFYTPGQRITDDTIRAIYCLELHSCAKLGSYMGLWQLAQLSSVLNRPLHTIYPV